MTKYLAFYSASGLIITLLLTAIPLHADKLYRWVDDSGVTHFTKEPPPEGISKPANSNTKANANLINERKEYLRERQMLEQQMSQATNEQRRNQFKRKLLALDYQWYKDKNPEKAAELKQALGQPQIREIPSQQKSESNMNKYKAFY